MAEVIGAVAQGQHQVHFGQGAGFTRTCRTAVYGQVTHNVKSGGK